MLDGDGVGGGGGAGTNATSSNDPYLVASRVFVGGIPSDKTTTEDMHRRFERYGEILEVNTCGSKRGSGGGGSGRGGAGAGSGGGHQQFDNGRGGGGGRSHHAGAVPTHSSTADFPVSSGAHHSSSSSRHSGERRREGGGGGSWGSEEGRGEREGAGGSDRHHRSGGDSNYHRGEDSYRDSSHHRASSSSERRPYGGSAGYLESGDGRGGPPPSIAMDGNIVGGHPLPSSSSRYSRDVGDQHFSAGSGDRFPAAEDRRSHHHIQDSIFNPTIQPSLYPSESRYLDERELSGVGGIVGNPAVGGLPLGISSHLVGSGVGVGPLVGAGVGIDLLAGRAGGSRGEGGGRRGHMDSISGDHGQPGSSGERGTESRGRPVSPTPASRGKVTGASRPFDAAILVLASDLRDYAEWVERRLVDLNLTVDVCFVLGGTDSRASRILESMAEKGYLYVIYINHSHAKHKSITLNVIHSSSPAEHRNMPLEDALQLVSKDLNAYLMKLRAGSEQPGVNFLLHLLSGGEHLTPGELDRILSHVTARRDRAAVGGSGAGVEEVTRAPTTENQAGDNQGLTPGGDTDRRSLLIADHNGKSSKANNNSATTDGSSSFINQHPPSLQQQPSTGPAILTRPPPQMMAGGPLSSPYNPIKSADPSDENKLGGLMGSNLIQQHPQLPEGGGGSHILAPPTTAAVNQNLLSALSASKESAAALGATPQGGPPATNSAMIASSVASAIAAGAAGIPTGPGGLFAAVSGMVPSSLPSSAAAAAAAAAVSLAAANSGAGGLNPLITAAGGGRLHSGLPIGHGGHHGGTGGGLGGTPNISANLQKTLNAILKNPDAIRNLTAGLPPDLNSATSAQQAAAAAAGGLPTPVPSAVTAGNGNGGVGGGNGPSDPKQMKMSGGGGGPNEDGSGSHTGVQGPGGGAIPGGGSLLSGGGGGGMGLLGPGGGPHHHQDFGNPHHHLNPHHPQGGGHPHPHHHHPHLQGGGPPGGIIQQHFRPPGMPPGHQMDPFGFNGGPPGGAPPQHQQQPWRMNFGGGPR